MGNTTYSLHSTPDLQLTLVAFNRLRQQYMDHLSPIQDWDKIEEHVACHNKILRLQELIQAIVEEISKREK